MVLAHADIQQLPIADSSIDMIFTDPPYGREFLMCYEWLARQSARVLKPGGFVFVMTGGYFLNQIFAMFDRQPSLEYFWEFHHFQNNVLDLIST